MLGHPVHLRGFMLITLLMVYTSGLVGKTVYTPLIRTLRYSSSSLTNKCD